WGRSGTEVISRTCGLFRWTQRRCRGAGFRDRRCSLSCGAGRFRCSGNRRLRTAAVGAIDANYGARDRVADIKLELHHPGTRVGIEIEWGSKLIAGINSGGADTAASEVALDSQHVVADHLSGFDLNREVRRISN